MIIDVEFPESDSPEVTAIMRRDIENLVEGFRKTTEGILLDEEVSEMGLPYGLWIRSEHTQFVPWLDSFIFTVSLHTGGAHPNTTIVTYTFNLEDNTPFAVTDLFAEDVEVYELLAHYAQEQIDVEWSDAEWITTGTEPTEANYRSWALSEDSLVLYFDPYQVAPYAVGVVKVHIPLAEIEGSLIEDLRFFLNDPVFGVE
jgi:hypothetical protein